MKFKDVKYIKIGNILLNVHDITNINIQKGEISIDINNDISDGYITGKITDVELKEKAED